jgi:nucleotide-binding universal stress UspA family protein
VAVEICDEAREVGATAIVSGSRGLTDLEGFIVGSTTHKLLHLSHLAVLVVR